MTQIYIGAQVDDMSVHICTLYRLSYVCIIYWGVTDNTCIEGII